MYSLGKNPVIVDPNYDLNLAAKRICWARFCNSGQVWFYVNSLLVLPSNLLQTCTAPDYVLIPAEAQDGFISALGEVYVGLQYHSWRYCDLDIQTKIILSRRCNKVRFLWTYELRRPFQACETVA